MIKATLEFDVENEELSTIEMIRIKARDWADLYWQLMEFQSRDYYGSAWESDQDEALHHGADIFQDDEDITRRMEDFLKAAVIRYESRKGPSSLE